MLFSSRDPEKNLVLDATELSRLLVEELIMSKLYVTDTPEFVVMPLSFTGRTKNEDWRAYFTTNLPDGMLYEVVKQRSESNPTVTAYKKEDV